MRTALLILFAVPLCAQDLHVTAETLSAPTVKSMFGPLNARYGAAKVTVCSAASVNASVPLALIGQQPGALPAGITVLPPVAALQVIGQAQGSTKTAKGFRIGIAFIEGAAVATSLSGVSATLKAALTNTALLGGQLIPIISAATTTQSLVSYAQVALADPLQIIPGGCASGLVLYESNPAAVRAAFSLAVPGTSIAPSPSLMQSTPTIPFAAPIGGKL